MNAISPEAYAAWQTQAHDRVSVWLVEFVERWLTLLDEDIAAHPELTIAEVLQQFADDRSNDADEIGMSGSFFGNAVWYAVKFWAHGEELRRWHNRDTQIGDEGHIANKKGTVLNPAVLVPNRRS